MPVKLIGMELRNVTLEASGIRGSPKSGLIKVKKVRILALKELRKKWWNLKRKKFHDVKCQ